MQVKSLIAPSQNLLSLLPTASYLEILVMRKVIEI